MPGTLNLTYTDGRGPFVLQAASDETPEGEFKITVITIYQEEGGSVVGLGDTGEGQYSVKAAFTFETREELRIEAEIYSTLPSEFKGDIFPYIHGYYEAEGIACPRIASGQGYNDAFLRALRGFKAQKIYASVAESDCDEVVQDRIW